MLFTDPIFLFIFLPIVLFCYFLAPKKIKNLVLMLFSLGFYAFSEQKLVILIIVSALVDFVCAIIITKRYRKIGLFLSISFNLLLLGYFKYSNFIFSNLGDTFLFLGIDSNKYATVILPIGISFFTFQTMSYTIDVYYKKINATTNFINFLTYVTLFPQLIAGPIVRYSEVEVELKKRTTSITQFSLGVERFIIGLSKKLLIANNCAFLADGIFSLPYQESSPLIALLGILAYGFQIYFDFSGYSDMAIGLGNMFGFKFPENFNQPFSSRSIQEFWQRWHITLSRWFKDYLYIPLGGNRINKNRTYFNLLIVFFITGLWHGANWTFILWGLFHGIFILLEKFTLSNWLKQHKFTSHIYTLTVVTLSWIIFRSNTITEAINYFKTLFNFKLTTNIEFLNFYMTKEVIIALILSFLLCIPINLKVKITNPYFKVIKLFVLITLCYIYIASGSYNPFIYFRF